MARGGYLFLKSQDSVFHGLSNYDAMDFDRFDLTNTVNTIDCLVFHKGIPEGIEDYALRCTGEIKSVCAGAKGNETDCL